MVTTTASQSDECFVCGGFSNSHRIWFRSGLGVRLMIRHVRRTAAARRNNNPHLFYVQLASGRSKNTKDTNETADYLGICPISWFGEQAPGNHQRTVSHYNIIRDFKIIIFISYLCFHQFSQFLISCSHHGIQICSNLCHALVRFAVDVNIGV